MRRIVIDVFEDGRAGMQVEGLDEWTCLRVLSALVEALTKRLATEDTSTSRITEASEDDRLKVD